MCCMVVRHKVDAPTAMFDELDPGNHTHMKFISLRQPHHPHVYETEPCIVFKRKSQLWGIEAKAQHWMVRLLILLRRRRLGRAHVGARAHAKQRAADASTARARDVLSATDAIKSNKKKRGGFNCFMRFGA